MSDDKDPKWRVGLKRVNEYKEKVKTEIEEKGIKDFGKEKFEQSKERIQKGKETIEETFPEGTKAFKESLTQMNETVKENYSNKFSQMRENLTKRSIEL